MRVYSVHVRADDAIAVREGFAWSALPLPILWAAGHRLWLLTLLVLAADLLLVAAWVHGWLGTTEAGLVTVAFRFLFAAEANDLFRRQLYWRGYVEDGPTTGRSADAALRRWADRRQGWDGAYA
ncbi:uncharacterized protein DUF2628 [Stella humosa]|uniref:Uncharacterized protein DUF2628 n=1 Tax=Stella humosa TaxID=94 RepID=A0A3N1L8H6_9PROT|nr:DUF2628 domain-containing protein [Stella humosa]ROP90983.1 uncharacterized protein DUF2628 [Stella humosa]BBK34667.1 hypothetical protein STHU_53010 [Stella humosa]